MSFETDYIIASALLLLFASCLILIRFHKRRISCIDAAKQLGFEFYSQPSPAFLNQIRQDFSESISANQVAWCLIGQHRGHRVLYSSNGDSESEYHFFWIIEHKFTAFRFYIGPESYHFAPFFSGLTTNHKYVKFCVKASDNKKFDTMYPEIQDRLQRILNVKVHILIEPDVVSGRHLGGMGSITAIIDPVIDLIEDRAANSA